MAHLQAASLPKTSRSPAVGSGKVHVSPTPSPELSPSVLSPPNRHTHAFPFDSPEPRSDGGSPPATQQQHQQHQQQGRQITPVNLHATATSVSNSELRMRASPMDRPGASATSLHAFPSASAASTPASFGMQSRHGHSGDSGSGGEYASGGSLSRPGSKPGTPMGSARNLSSSSAHPRRNSFSLIAAAANAISSPSAPSRRSGILTQLLCFIGGMVLSYVLLSASLTPSPAVVSVPHAESGMSGVAQRLATAINPAAAPCPVVTPPPPPPAAPAAPASMASLLSSGKTPQQLQAELRAALPICGPHEYGDGEWVWDESVTKAPYISHEWDNVCDNPEAPPPAAAADGPASATTPAAPTLRPELRWKWVPRSCRLVPYTRDHFCELLAGRNILFAGDSISGQHVLSFVHLLHSNPDQLWIRDEFFRNDFINVCQDHYPVAPGATSSPAGLDQHGRPLPGIRVGFRRNNFLSLHRDVNYTEEHRKWNTNQSWLPHIDEQHFRIAVINTGIWMVDAPIYRSMLTDIAAALRKDHPSLTVLWRSTQPGHAFCHTHWSRPQARLYGQADTTGGSARFRWEEAEARNEIARDIFAEQFFDVWNATHLRPDGHMPGECLHYCQPGPLDEWHKFLYHRLAIQNPAFVQKVLATEAAGAAAPLAKVAATSSPAPAATAPTPAAPVSPPAATPAATSAK